MQRLEAGDIARRFPALETGDDREQHGVSQQAQNRKVIGRGMIEVVDPAALLSTPDGKKVVQAEQLRRVWASRPPARVEIEPRSAKRVLQRGDLLEHGVGPRDSRLGRGEQIKDAHHA